MKQRHIHLELKEQRENVTEKKEKITHCTYSLLNH